MKREITFTLLPKELTDSVYTWIQVEYDSIYVGKVRSIVDGDTLTICSINIFSQYQHRGYARSLINELKKKYGIIIADRVRYTAIKFWKAMGFSDNGDGSYIFRKTNA